MLSDSRRVWGAAAAAFALALGGCGSVDRHPRGTATRPPPRGGAVVDYPVKIGLPYQVRGRTYMPADVPDYDEVGYASWYGAESGGTTANGERFVPNGVTAAHKTLPLPSYVEVTALETGRTILVRVNDRGPFADDRVIDLSRGAAVQLGIERQGTAPVRVRRVDPPERDKARLRAGNAVEERSTLSAGTLAALSRKLADQRRGRYVAASLPARQPRLAPGPSEPEAPLATFPAPPPSVMPSPASSVSGAGGNWFVQIGAFGSRARAETIARPLGAGVQAAGSLYRVRLGPYASEVEARAGVAKASQAGYHDAHVLKD